MAEKESLTEESKWLIIRKHAKVIIKTLREGGTMDYFGLIIGIIVFASIPIAAWVVSRQILGR